MLITPLKKKNSLAYQFILVSLNWNFVYYLCHNEIDQLTHFSYLIQYLTIIKFFHICVTAVYLT